MMQTLHLKHHFFLAPDIDECHTANTCHQNATCNNTKGSYNCTCKGGFKGDGRINCTGKVLLKSIPNHKSQNGTFLSSKTELPATFEFACLTTQEFSVSSFDSLSTLPKPSLMLISFKSEFHSLFEKRYFYPPRFLSAAFTAEVEGLASKETKALRRRGILKSNTNRRVNPRNVSFQIFFRWELD